MLTFPVTLFASGATRTFLQAETPQLAAGPAYTFSGVNIGAAATDRYVVVEISNAVNAPGRTLNTVTIGGSAATIHVNAHLDTGAAVVIVGIAGLLVTAGTTANIVATFSGNMNTCYCRTYTLQGLTSTTPTATKTTTNGAGATTVSDTIDIPANGILLFGVQTDASTGSYSVTGATLDSTQNTNNLPSASASLDSLGVQVARPYSATVSAATTATAMAAAAWN